MLRVTFDPAVTSYEALLSYYAANHTPRRSAGQYRSLLFTYTAAQRDAAAVYINERSGGPTPEVIDGATPEGRFWDAEDYHQKYRMRRDTGVVAALIDALGSSWDEHSLATKLNAHSDTFSAEPWVALLPAAGQRIFWKYRNLETPRR